MKGQHQNIQDFKSVSDYIDALKDDNYWDMGWQNGWGEGDYETINDAKGERETISYGLHNTTHLTVIHEAKIFYRCDSGD